MIKQILLLVNLLVMLFMNMIFPDDVSLEMTASNQVEAGSEIYVEVTLNKSDVQSFARFQQKLPAGLTPTAIHTANADFSFDNQRIKFIWLRLPEDETITISYKIKVNERLKGNFNLAGNFSFIADNERKSVSVTPKTVVITPSPTVDPSMIVDVQDYKELVSPVERAASSMANVRCIRQAPYAAPESNAYVVNILVNKGNKEKFAKIQEEIPAGYTAENLENQEAIFTFKDQTVKYLWMNLPADPYFVVSYKLVPVEGDAAPENIDGTFSYIENENTLSIDIEQKQVDLANSNSQQLLSIINDSKQPDLSQYSSYEASDHSGSVKIEIAEKAKALLAKEGAAITNQLEPQNGVYYRVQIAAGHRPINIERYFRKYNLDKEVRTEFHEGWRKYSIGSFDIYKAARDYRVHIWNTTTIDDAFVAAYNDGNRITVQEALMISNHKWYR